MQRPHIKASERNRGLTSRMSSLTDGQDSQLCTGRKGCPLSSLLLDHLCFTLSHSRVCFPVTVSSLSLSHISWFFFIPHCNFHQMFPSFLLCSTFCIATLETHSTWISLSGILNVCFWPHTLLWCWLLSAEPAPRGRECNADLDGPVMRPTVPVCGAWGVYFCGRPTAALLI